MTQAEKQRAVRAVEAFWQAVSYMTADSDESRDRVMCEMPKPMGLGTDGTCWSDQEHRDYYLAVIAKAKQIFRRQCPAPDGGV